MFSYQKKLQYPVKIDKPNPKLASIIISQYGGPDGELGASLRYLSQRYSMPFDELKGLLTDIGTEWSKWGTPEEPPECTGLILLVCTKRHLALRGLWQNRQRISLSASGYPCGCR